MNAENGACVLIEKGSVGETGAASLMTHLVSGPTSKMLVLRNTQSSLCPNTGAIALLTINGIPVAAESFTAVGSLMQTEAPPGSLVAAVVQTIPLMNGVVCVRLGRLQFSFEECDLVHAAGQRDCREGVVAAPAPPTRDWSAWNNRLPPPPDDFHVRGEVQVSNPGVEVFLSPRTPQGINPAELLLDLVLVQRGGYWPQRVVWKPAVYDKVAVAYTSVQIFFEQQSIVTIPVLEVS